MSCFNNTTFLNVVLLKVHDLKVMHTSIFFSKLHHRSFFWLFEAVISPLLRSHPRNWTDWTQSSVFGENRITLNSRCQKYSNTKITIKLAIQKSNYDKVTELLSLFLNNSYSKNQPFLPKGNNSVLYFVIKE